ncbi:uncharacterized protein LOC123538232 [Mercenaria mercenaria]|uniref:uncharacterized protein LOC123538232 n=1 Tax=Mercenaria mercenaria TaxID=6596 RepID=UPI00234F23B8|nr:uncharacterized protein LOC123538232 [Mercenaria mercenaria]
MTNLMGDNSSVDETYELKKGSMVNNKDIIEQPMVDDVTSEIKPEDMKHEDSQQQKKFVKPVIDKSKIRALKREKKVVTNLSSRILTEAELSLLSKGLSFVPTRHRVDMTKIHSDLAEWERRMRLKEYFHDKEDTYTVDLDEEPWCEKKKSEFTPEPGRDKYLDAYIEEVKNAIVNGIHDKCTSNLSKSERKAMKALLNDNNIIIRPADKGSGIVIVDAEDYIKKLEKEVKDNASYMKTDGGAQYRAEKEVKKITNKMCRDGLISKKLKDYLIQKHPVTGKLKGNPKIHKRENPYRTIVSGIGTATERMAEVAEKELNEYVENSPSYLKDTTDFLNKLKLIPLPIPEGVILFCFDVVKLYPSIPRREGLTACEEALQCRTNPNVTTEAVMKMINTVLTNNVFSFNNSEYVQKEGVAIGSKLGRNFACCYMRKWDEKLMENEKVPMFYKRYIDDGFGLWQHGLEDLLKFRDFANQIHPNIKVELRWHTTRIEFLDTTVRIEKNNEITTVLYSKPTDKHLYLNWKSDHPQNVKKAIPYGLGVRLKRICSTEADYAKQRQELRGQLRRKGYSGKFIENQLDRVDKIDRAELLTPQKLKKEKMKRVPVVVTYSRHLPNLHNIVRKHMNTLHKSERMKHIFSDTPIVAYRRDTNISDLLVHGKTNKVMKQYQTGDLKPRCYGKCVVCEMIDKGRHNNDKAIAARIERTQTCQAWNLVYGINCIQCDKIVYIGETSRSLKERLREHEADIRLKRTKPVAEHFNTPGHSIGDVGVSVLEHMKENSRYYRQIKELDWIHELQTEAPNGLNTKAKLDLMVKCKIL